MMVGLLAHWPAEGMRMLKSAGAAPLVAALVKRRAYTGCWGADGALVRVQAGSPESQGGKMRRRAGKRQRRKAPASPHSHITQHRWLWLHTQLGGTLVQHVPLDAAPPQTLPIKAVSEAKRMPECGVDSDKEVVVLVDADNSANILK